MLAVGGMGGMDQASFGELSEGTLSIELTVPIRKGAFWRNLSQVWQGMAK